MFSIMVLIIGSKGDKVSKIIVSASVSPGIFSPSSLIMNHLLKTLSCQVMFYTKKSAYNAKMLS